MWVHYNIFLNYQWGIAKASQVSLVVKNLPASAGDITDTGSGGEDPLEEGMTTHSSIFGESHGQRSLVGYSPKGCKELDTTEATASKHCG